MRYSISQILQMANDISDKAIRISFLQQNDSQALRTIIKAGLCPSTKWLIQKGDIVYTPNEFPNQEGNLIRESKRFYLFIEGHGADNLDQQKRVNLFIQMLEVLDKNDAKLIVALKDGQWPFKGRLSATLINQAFPGLIETNFKKSSRRDPEKDF